MKFKNGFSNAYFETDNGILINGDCLEKLKLIPNKSINLIVIDPPYNIGKDKWDKWETVEDYIEFMGKVFRECERVLKDNGSFYFFHNDFLQIAELQHWLRKNTEFTYKSLITWNKTNFKKFAWTNRNPEKCKDRNWFPNVEYCLYYTFQGDSGLNKALKQDGFQNIMNYFKDERNKPGWSYKKCDDFLGIKASYCYWDKPTTHPYRIPDEKNYKKLQETGYFKKEYENLRQEYENLRQEYENLRYTYNLKEVQDNISCVWESSESNSGKLHSCEKPQDILQKIIKTSSNENDVILDCFSGSGTLAQACEELNRKWICIEKEEKYCEATVDRLKEYIK